MTTAGSFDREMQIAARSTQQPITIRRVLRGVLEQLGSLKLTVGLLLLAVFIIWVASLQQTRTDIWAVKSQHFSSPVVCIPFSIFFPAAWFPQMQSLQGNCYLPSGITVLVAMIINLLAAHLFRMRIQASGTRLIFGLLVAAVGLAVTWVVVFSAQDPDGFQGSTAPEFFRRLWYVIHAALVGVGIASAVASFRMARERMLAKIAMGFFAGLMLAGFILLLVLGERAFIGDSAMRILWQLIQGTMAAAVMMIACLLLFKRKGAVVLIHVGILMLMVNEVYVSLTNHEQQMYIAEGETTSVAVDIRASEMVIVNSTDPENAQVTSIPASLLQKGGIITDVTIPFELKCSRFFVNADLKRIDPTSKAENNSNVGIGKVFEAVELPPTPAIGTERKNDRPAAYVELFKKGSNESLGKFLISMLAFDNEVLDSVTVDGKTFQIGLRHKTTVKSYGVQLLDAEKTTYPGTSIPKTFASNLLLTDRDRGLIDSPQRVWMNNPLRYGNETFYQSGMDEANGREYTVLQIVKNSGWMIPYVACMFVVLGLVVQFGTNLEKMVQTKSAAAVTNAEPNNKFVFYSLAAIVGIALVPYAAGEIYKGIRPNVKFAEMRLDKLGRLPLLFEGRLQPLDSLARNTARQLSGRENVLIQDGSKKPAIRWLADTVFRYPGWEKYRVLRITDLNVLNELGLTPASPFMYSFEDLGKDVTSAGKTRPRFAILEEQAENAKKLPEDQLSVSQKRLIDLRQKITMVKNLQVALGDPKHVEQQDGFLTRLQIGGFLAASKELPQLIRVKPESDEWTTVANAKNRQWLANYAKSLGATTAQQLAEVIFADKILLPLKTEMANREMIRLLQEDPEISGLLDRLRDKPEGERDLITELKKMPAEKLAAFSKQAEANIEPQIIRASESYISEVKQQIEAIGFDQKVVNESQSVSEIPLALEDLYVEKKAEEFNLNLDRYLESFASPTWPSFGLSAEILYNYFSPFYWAMIFYLVGAVLASVAFIGYPREFGRVVMWVLLLGISIQFFGIVLRVFISGRPPVTTLYSSVIFISACCVGLLLIVERITRINVGNLLAGAAGFGLLNWAASMAVKDGDTFTVLVAVLDTQFWLSTHVICISLGYVATIGAGAVGAAALVIWLVSYLRGRAETQTATIKKMSDVVYGVVCFGLLFSFFGTVLGGLWADDSWGRFWGWDTKENGALMIVFWNAVLLHARWAGIIRAKGIAAISTLGIAVTFWSWQGVNLLGVGLHNYGFNEEGLQILFAVVGACGLVAAIGLIPNPPVKRMV